MTFAAKRLFHPTHMVPDLKEAVSFFDRVFSRRSFYLSEFVTASREDTGGTSPGISSDYGIFTPIADVLFESIEPARMVANGRQLTPDVTTGRLKGLAWFADDVEDLWSKFRRAGLHGTDQLHMQPEGDGPPRTVNNIPIIFTIAEEVGLRYEFVAYFEKFDPRGESPPPDILADDPLGIEHCSHHTILTDRFDRARNLLVDLAGGRVIGEARNPVLASDSVYIAFADGIVELARPLEEGSPAMLDWQQHAPFDTYHALTWKVQDLDRVEDHLRAVGVGTRTRTDTTIVADPADALGVPWGFTTQAIAAA